FLVHLRRPLQLVDIADGRRVLHRNRLLRLLLLLLLPEVGAGRLLLHGRLARAVALAAVLLAAVALPLAATFVAAGALLISLHRLAGAFRVAAVLLAAVALVLAAAFVCTGALLASRLRVGASAGFLLLEPGRGFRRLALFRTGTGAAIILAEAVHHLGGLHGAPGVRADPADQLAAGARLEHETIL